MGEPQQKIAVTGAEGFVGSRCVLSLLEAGFDVVAVVMKNSDPSKNKFLEEEATKIQKENNLSFAEGQLFEEGSYDAAFEGVWGVLHCAAIVQMGAPKDAYDTIVKPSVKGTNNVLASVKKHTSTIRRYVHISSIAAILNLNKGKEYEKSGNAYDENDWNEWSTVEKGDAYGYAKTTAEKIVSEDQELQSKLEAVVRINPAMVLGPCLTKSQAKNSTARQVTAFLTGKFTPQGYWHWVDVRDVAKAVVLAFQTEASIVNGQRFLLSGIRKCTHYSELGKIIKMVHPSAKGSIQAPSISIIVFALWLCTYFPFMKKPLGYTEIWNFWDLQYEMDVSKSKKVLGMGEYRSLEETCRDACVAIEALIKDEPAEWVNPFSYFSVVD